MTDRASWLDYDFSEIEQRLIGDDLSDIYRERMALFYGQYKDRLRRRFTRVCSTAWTGRTVEDEHRFQDFWWRVTAALRFLFGRFPI